MAAIAHLLMLRRAQIGAFVGCAAIIGVLFYWFDPSTVDDCSFNVGITVFTLVLCVLVAMAPLHPSVRCHTWHLALRSRIAQPVAESHAVSPSCVSMSYAAMAETVIWRLDCTPPFARLSSALSSLQYSALLSVVDNCAQIPSGSLFPASVVALYCCYLAYSALQSEPHDYVCNGLGQRLNAASGTTLAVGMALALARWLCLAALLLCSSSFFSRKPASVRISRYC